MRHLMVILGLGLPIGLVSAQTFGTITAEVKDPSGAAAPNAPVIATNLGTNATRETTTNDSGVYSFPSLVPGIYSMKISIPGFQIIERTNIELQVQQTARIDFTLALGQATQTNLDFSVHKDFPLTERQRLQFRFGTFNTANHPQFGNPNTNWGSTNQTPSASFGTIRTTATDMRQMQAALKYIF